MTNPPLSESARALITQPEVLLCAWDKLNDWYRGELKPEPEYSLYSLRTNTELQKLANEIASGKFELNRFPLVPFPKKGGEIRHYTCPTVRDQLSFMIFGVLLGPLFEIRFLNVSTGNRWYRPIVLKSGTGDLPCWIPQKYSLSDSRLNLPFTRSYGLFRRVAHWRTKAIIQDRFEHSEEVFDNPENYDPELIAYHDKTYARPESINGEKTAYYGRLDLSKAYPCVDRKLLAEKIRALLTTNVPDSVLRKSFHADSVWMSLEKNKRLRLELAKRMSDLLMQVEYEPGLVRDSWLNPPEQAKENVPSNDRIVHGRLTEALQENKFGLPTGLAVAGLLFNVYLDSFDKSLVKSLIVKKNELKGIYLRFVDDIIIVAHSKKAFLEVLGVIAKSFPTNKSELGLFISLQKTRPEGLGSVIQALDLKKPQGKGSLPSKCAITKDNLGEFVTDLVQQLSELGGETADELLGEHGEVRLRQLHDLIRVDRKDAEVKDDTRISFAAFKLSRHPLAFWSVSRNASDESDEIKTLRAELREIRSSIMQAIQMAPWKHRIWNAAITAYCRQIRGTDGISASNIWMKSLLKKIAVGGSWEKEFPEQKKTTSDNSTSRLAASFLRTHFWIAWADAVRSLATIQPEHASGRWGPDHWAWFLIPEDLRGSIFEQLCDIKSWMSALYSGREYKLPFWEAQALAGAFFAANDLSLTLAYATEGELFSRDPATIFTRFLKRWKLVTEIEVTAPIAALRHSARLDSIRNRDILALWQAHRDQVFLDRFTIFSKLNLLARLSPAKYASLFKGIKTEIPNDAWSKYTYQTIRSESLAHNSMPELLVRHARQLFPKWEPRDPVTDQLDVYALLWGAPDYDVIRPASVPAIGLPPGIVILMLDAALHSQASPAVFSWEIKQNALDFLKWGRGSQLKVPGPFRGAEFTQQMIQLSQSCSVPPHPAFAFRESSGWHNSMLALVALSGSEKILDKIWGARGEPINFEDRFAWRNEISAPIEFWRALEDSFQSDRPVWVALRKHLKLLIGTQLITAKQQGQRREEIKSLFKYTRIDVDLKSNHLSENPIGLKAKPPKIPDGGFLENIVVRMAQLDECPRREEIISNWPNLGQRVSQRLYCALIESLPDVGKQARSSARPQIVVFPEAYLPHGRNYVYRLRKTLRRRNLAILTGLYWHELPSGVIPSKGLAKSIRYFANEALLLMPISRAAGERPYLMREFIIPKPLPAISEYALAQVVSEAGVQWQIVPGTKWHRFLHPFWGNFSVAICSDILDPTPWAHFRGDIQHLFLIAYNDDVDLYQSLTWTRAYECYVNMVAVNHGAIGGSFSWTPKHRHHKELAVLKGARLRVVVDVKLPVKDLVDQQRNGWGSQMRLNIAKWKEQEHELPKWKSPPHFFAPEDL